MNPSPAEKLSRSLRQRGVVAGGRIRSERELVERLGWDLQEVRRAIGQLVEEGLLFRKRGSGTYVRKVPGAALAEGGQAGVISVEDLLAEERESSGRGEVTAQVAVGIWTDLFWAAQSHQVFLTRLSALAAEGGHTISINSICTAPEKVLSHDALRHQLERHPADGYIVPDWCAKEFLQAMDGGGKPCLFYGGSGVGTAASPVVFFDVGRALQHGVERLAESGYRRIAMFLLASAGQSLREEKLFYSSALGRHGLTYEAVECADLSASRSLAAVRRLLDGKNPPDAVFVGDDYLLDAFSEVLRERGLVPGRDIGVVALSSKGGHPLHGRDAWSCMEFDSSQLARIAFTNLLELMSSFDAVPQSLALQATWKPGTTHLRSGQSSPVSQQL